MKHTFVRIVALAVAPMLALFACRDDVGDRDTSIDPQVYVAVMGELADIRKFPPPATGDMDREATADSAREAILIAHGVTAPEMLAFAQSAGSNPTLMETLADRIAALTDSLAEARDTVSADSASTVADTIVETSEALSVDSVKPSPAEALSARRRERTKLFDTPEESPPR